ncbi:3-ketoacyl-ACP reductase [Thalassobacillus devorans]|uniref:3-ketoacyl-ACP reductase n=1 Tax=Thalassobacillus devorans TaxID=279813 RepID=A0ABQ1NP95_9BACI|nr:SDR family oxidoreductase [Thalassobacillus devorans]NIK27281.1 3-oxoacyl-[acyl-carrier protein] reductase [Thalassobacillus devorans]GGC76430.1 3-ketoacyl-ACP reductase [Thalassobacillus devorans]
MNLENHAIVVTGANGGMGLSIVERLLEKGARVTACDIQTDKLEELDHDRLLVKGGNMLEEEQVEAIFREANDQFGKVDGLVNAAGIAQKATPIESVSLDEWRKLMDINTTMLFLTCREAAKYMKQNKHGSIVNIASISVVRPRPGLQSYIASKGAAESFSKALAIELAEHQVRVNTIHPGPCDTNMLGQFAADGTDVEQAKETVFKQSVPMGELLTPTDIAASVAFLLTDEAKMVTGAVLNVDGGRGL